MGLPEGGTAPTSWSAHEVEEQAAHDGEGLEDLHILARTEDQAEDCAAVCHPESSGSEADQDQCSPTRPQPDQERQRTEKLGGDQDCSKYRRVRQPFCRER